MIPTNKKKLLKPKTNKKLLWAGNLLISVTVFRFVFRVYPNDFFELGYWAIPGVFGIVIAILGMIPVFKSGYYTDTSGDDYIIRGEKKDK